MDGEALQAGELKNGSELWKKFRTETDCAVEKKDKDFSMARKVETIMPIESLHNRYNNVYDYAEALRGLVARRKADCVDLGTLQVMLREVEAEKKAVLAALRLARHQTSVAYPAAGLAPSTRELGRV